MKTIKFTAITIALCLLAAVGFSQTLTSGTYASGSFQGSQNIIIAGNVTITGSGIGLKDGTYIEVKSGGTLTLTDNFTTNNAVIIDKGGVINAKGDLEDDRGGATINGTLYVAGTWHMNTPNGTTMSSCSFVQTNILFIDNDNVVTGSGLIVASSYNNQGTPGPNNWPGHPLSTSSSIYLNCNTTLNIGSAQHSTSSAGCNTVTPLTLVSFGETVSNGSVNFTWQTKIESKMDHYEVWDITDSTHAVMVGSVKTQAPGGDSNSPLNYEFSLPIQQIALAGFGGVVILGLAIGLIGKSRKLSVVPICVIMVVAASCTKSVIQKANATMHTKIYQLRGVGIDGSISYEQQQVAVEVKY